MFLYIYIYIQIIKNNHHPDHTGRVSHILFYYTKAERIRAQTGQSQEHISKSVYVTVQFKNLVMHTFFTGIPILKYCNTTTTKSPKTLSIAYYNLLVYRITGLSIKIDP